MGCRAVKISRRHRDHPPKGSLAWHLNEVTYWKLILEVEGLPNAAEKLAEAEAGLAQARRAAEVDAAWRSRENPAEVGATQNEGPDSGAASLGSDRDDCERN
ncbi:MAG: hypothetical protein CTY28_09590 [Hyphomicrobium sp.]|nr:MAG: hypothetical protein CTY28_09590 [Hyphomicrobium sp.]